MLERITDRFKFALERFFLGGPLNRLLAIAILIGLITILGGTLVYLGGQGESVAGMRFHEALWWAFLRLSDPGYLGDDVGTVTRIVSTVLTLLGYVVFLGSLVAIMTQWLNSSLARLQAGYTPLALNNHILILGWSSRTVSIVREILLSESRVKRFLSHRGAGKLRVVILAEEVGPAMFQELRDRLGDDWDPRQIILRTGSALRLEHLRRADFLRAGAILLPSPAAAGEEVEYPDARTIKTILAAGLSGRGVGVNETPLMVAELEDARKVDIAREAYGGPIEVIASDLIVARLLAQNIRHPGLSHVYAELLRRDVGSEIYVRDLPELVGRQMMELAETFQSAVAIGLLRGNGGVHDVILNPAPELLVESGDRLVLLAPGYEEADPGPAAGAAGTLSKPSAPRALARRSEPLRRVLVLGWNHATPALIHELDSYTTATFSVDVMSQVPSAVRAAELARFSSDPIQMEVRLLEGEYTALSDVRALEPSTYHTVVVLATDRLESESERDARTILGSLVLSQALSGASSRPHTLVEILDFENIALVRTAGHETLLSPAVMSHILAQVALNRELRAVYDELFGPDGAEIFFRSAAEFGVCGSPVGFAQIQHAASMRGETALGIRFFAHRSKPGGGVRLNPNRAESWTLQEQDEIVVLTNY